MNIANIYRSLKKVLSDSNMELSNRGLNTVENLSEIPAEISKLGTINRLPYVFQGEIVKLTERDFDESSTYIPPYVFYGMHSLRDVTIKQGITNIGNESFYGCINLKSVTIPSSVTSIGIQAFDGLSTDIYIYSTTPPIAGGSAFTGNTTIHVPIGSYDKYKSATNWSAWKIVGDIMV